jgi:hypothetical protein
VLGFSKRKSAEKGSPRAKKFESFPKESLSVPFIPFEIF